MVATAVGELRAPWPEWADREAWRNRQPRQAARDASAGQRLTLSPGAEVELSVDPQRCLLFPQGAG